MSCEKESERIRLNLTIIDGDQQSAFEGDEIASPIRVQLTDLNGVPIEGVDLTAVITKGTGKVVEGSLQTDKEGMADFKIECGSSYRTWVNIVADNEQFISNSVLTLSFSNYCYHVPPKDVDHIKAGHLNDAGVDSAYIVEMFNFVRDSDPHNVNAVLLVKDNRLVLEEYFDGYDFKFNTHNFHGPFTEWDRNTKHCMHSTTKSFTSTLIGIAIDLGYINDVDDRMFDYLPNYLEYKREDNQDITVEHLLTMSSGFKWNQNHLSLKNPANDLLRFNRAEDPWAYVLSKPVIHEPGTEYYYNCGGINLLGMILRNSTGQTIMDFSKYHLFTPLGIYDYYWSMMTDEMPSTSGDIYLKPGDMLKFGWMYLNDGIYGDKRILPEDWINRSVSRHVELLDEWEYLDCNGYGYCWWLSSLSWGEVSSDFYYTSGWGSQHIIVIPDFETVIVFTGDRYTGQTHMQRMLREYIFPAIVSGGQGQ